MPAIPKAAWRQFELDPAFRALNYDEQVYVKTKKAQQFMLNDPGFHRLSPEEQAYAFNKYTQTPTFETDLNTPVGQHLTNLMDIARQVKSNNDNELTRRIQSWFFDARLTGIQSVPAKLISDALNSLGLPQQTSKITGEKIVNLQDLYRDPATMRDIKKIHKYNDILIQDVPGMKIANALREFAFTMLEAGIYNKILVGSGESVMRHVLSGGNATIRGGLLTNKIFQGLAKTYMKTQNPGVFKTIGMKLAPILIEEGAEGLVWATRGILDDIVSGEERTTTEHLIEFGKDFGLGMAAQALFAAGANLKYGLGLGRREILGVTENIIDPKRQLRPREGTYVMLEGLKEGIIPTAIEKDLRARGFGQLIDEQRAVARQLQLDDTINLDDPFSLAKEVMKTQGVALTRNLDDTLKMRSFLPIKFEATANDFGDAFKKLDGFVNKVSGNVSVSDIFAKGILDDKLKLRKIDELITPSGQKVSARQFINNINPEDGQIRAPEVMIGVRNFLKRSGASDKLLDSLNAKYYDDYFEAKRYDLSSGNELPLPRTIKTTQEQTEYLAGLSKFLREKANLEDIKLNSKKMEDIFNRLAQPRGNRYLTDDVWIERQLREIKSSAKHLPDGRYELRHADGTVEIFRSKEALGQSLYNSIISPRDVTNFVENEFGYTLGQDNLGDWYINAEGRSLGPYKDVEQLLKNHPQFRPPYPLESGPKVSIIDEAQTRVRVHNAKTVSGPVDLIERHLKNHSDWKFKKKLVRKNMPAISNKNVGYIPDKNQYILEDLATGQTRKFRSLDGKGGVRTYMQNITNRLDDLADQASMGGYRLSANKHGFYLTKGDKAFQASTIEDLEQLISREVKNLDAPELTSNIFPEHVTQKMKRIFETEVFDLPPAGKRRVEEALADKKNSMGLWENFKDAMSFQRGAFGTLEGILKRYPAAKPMVEMAQALKIKTFDHTRHMNSIAMQLKARVKSAKLSKTQKETMTMVLMEETPSSEWVNIAKRLNRPINDKMIEEMHFIRDLFDRLQVQFKIPKSLRIDNYFPRLRRAFDKEITSEGIIGEAAEVIRKSMKQGQLPVGADEFFRHVRTSDVLSFVLEKDPYAIAMKYMDLGFKKQGVEPIWLKLNTALKTYKETGGAAGLIPQRGLKTLQHVLDSIRGQNNSQALKTIQDFTLNGTIHLSKALKKVEDKILQIFPDRAFDEKASITTKTRDTLTGFSRGVITNDPFAVLSQALIGATQAFKPWLVMRNLHQPLMTVAPFFGVDYTLAGYKTATDPRNFKKLFNYMHQNSFLNTHAPTEIPTVRTRKGLFQKINDVGLNAYKWSDHVTRMVAFATVDHKFTDALAAMRKNPNLDKRWFIKHSGLFSVDTNTQDAVFKTLINGDVAGARDIFARQVISNGLFDYMGAANPRMFTGAKGKVLGTFGTYPVQYTENVYRMLRSGDMEDKALAVARLIGVSAALTSVYSDIFDTEVQSFNPFSTMFFTGSPVYQQLHDLVMIGGGVGHAVQTADYDALFDFDLDEFGESIDFGFQGQPALEQTMHRIPRTFLPYVDRAFDLVTGGIDASHGDTWQAVKRFGAVPGRNQ